MLNVEHLMELKEENWNIAKHSHSKTNMHTVVYMDAWTLKKALHTPHFKLWNKILQDIIPETSTRIKERKDRIQWPKLN